MYQQHLLCSKLPGRCVSRLNGDCKACFGVHVEGRSVSVEGIARMTGPVGAVVPCAIDLAPLQSGDSLLGIVREHMNAVPQSLHTPSSSETSTRHGIEATSQSFGNILIIHSDPAADPKTGPPEILELMQTRISECAFDGARLVTRCRIMPNGTACIKAKFDKKVISPEAIEILLQQYKHAIMQLLLQASAPLADLERVSSHERSLLFEWSANNPSHIDACIQDQIREIAKRHPTAPAIHSWNCALDYGQLDDLSDRMAALLQDNGISAGIVVPYICKRSAAAVVVMLGILKAGAALVALDLNHPVQRRATILADVGASIIVASSTLSESVNTKLTANNTVFVDMERIRNLPLGGPK